LAVPQSQNQRRWHCGGTVGCPHRLKSHGPSCQRPCRQPRRCPASHGLPSPLRRRFYGAVEGFCWVAVCSPLVGLTAQSPACWIRGHGRRCLNRLPPGGSGLSQHRCGAAVLPLRWFSEQHRNRTQCTTTAPHLPKTLQHRPIGALRSHRCHEGVSNMNCAVNSFQSERAEIFSLYYMFFDYPCATQRRG